MSHATENNTAGTPPDDNHGRAAFGPGSTTQGGSNFGQGSSDIGGTGYNKQGSEANRGSNYDNEAGELGKSTVGTSNEGDQSPTAGAAKEAPFTPKQDTHGIGQNAPETEPEKRINLGADDNLGA